jgi:hypothetical protein
LGLWEAFGKAGLLLSIFFKRKSGEVINPKKAVIFLSSSKALRFVFGLGNVCLYQK